MSHRLVVQSLRTLALVSFAMATVLPASGRGPDVSKYPLRIQVLAATAHDRFRQDRFPSGGSGEIEGLDVPMLTGSGPQLGLYSIPLYNGEGWGDLVSSEVPQAVKFTYANCLNRIASTMAREPLAARWKESGKGRVMEVLVPVDVIPSLRKPKKADVTKYVECEIPVTLYDYVYLLLKNGSIIKVTRQAYADKPQLHQFVQSGDPTLKEHPEPPPSAAAKNPQNNSPGSLPKS
ncbi:MAG: hypothetical protein ABSA39_04465 [Edaphobacter sp.]